MNYTMPKYVQVTNSSRPIAAPAKVEFCDTFLCRLRGLMFRPRLNPDDGLLLVEKRDSRLDASIHMFFVSFDLAVIWINSDRVVVDKVLAKSWKPAYFPKAEATYTLEIHPNHWADYEIGDKVEFKDA